MQETDGGVGPPGGAAEVSAASLRAWVAERPGRRPLPVPTEGIAGAVAGFMARLEHARWHLRTHRRPHLSPVCTPSARPSSEDRARA